MIACAAFLPPPPPRAGAFRSAAPLPQAHGLLDALPTPSAGPSTMPEAEGEAVQLFVYDLSGGMARAFSQMLLGRTVRTQEKQGQLMPLPANACVRKQQTAAHTCTGVAYQQQCLQDAATCRQPAALAQICPLPPPWYSLHRCLKLWPSPVPPAD